MIPTDILVPAAIIGLASAIFVELLKVFPRFGETDQKRRITALVVSLVFSILYLLNGAHVEGVDAVGLVLLTCSMTFAIYKSVIQGIAEPTKAYLSKFIGSA